jgi:hypothetical protein
MKTLKMLMLLMVVSTLSWGQAVVDHSSKFPPIRSQQCIPDCSLFSYIYYLGTYELCQKYSLDPKREENQLNHNFVWNQLAGADGHTNANGASLFMGQYGCATVADMAINEEDPEIMPSLSAKENALRYRTKPVVSLLLARRSLPSDMEELRRNLETLKDSLRHGVCFSMGLQVFSRAGSISPENPVYGCDSKINEESFLYSHAVCVVGYNDTIKTPEGRGAFIILDSGFGSTNTGGIWYYDYNWFFLYERVVNWCHFFQEDFRSDSELTMKLDLSGTVTGDELSARQYFFVDQVFQSDNRWIDYDWESDLMFYRMLQIEKVNGRYPEKGGAELKYLPVNGKVILLPTNNHDGHRQLVSDLTDYVSASEFKSLEILVQDPVFAEYIGEGGKVLYSYEREAKASLNEGYIKFAGTDKRIYARVVNLPDTTVICNNFYSYPVGTHITPYQGDAYISKCTSVIRRFLITFDIADITSGVEDLSLRGNNSGLTLGQNYPNPVRDMTTINFSIAAHSSVSLKIYDLMGREVETLVSSDLPPGEHQINFDASRLSHGVYVYILRTRDGLESKRMIKE